MTRYECKGKSKTINQSQLIPKVATEKKQNLVRQALLLVALGGDNSGFYPLRWYLGHKGIIH